MHKIFGQLTFALSLSGILWAPPTSVRLMLLEQSRDIVSDTLQRMLASSEKASHHVQQLQEQFACYSNTIAQLRAQSAQVAQQPIYTSVALQQKFYTLSGRQNAAIVVGLVSAGVVLTGALYYGFQKLKALDQQLQRALLIQQSQRPAQLKRTTRSTATRTFSIPASSISFNPCDCLIL